MGTFQKPRGTCLAHIGNVAITAPLDIAFVMTSFETGGTERQMIELFRRLDRSRWRPHVACFRGRGTWYSRVTEAAASVAEFPVVALEDVPVAGFLSRGWDTILLLFKSSP